MKLAEAFELVQLRPDVARFTVVHLPNADAIQVHVQKVSGFQVNWHIPGIALAAAEDMYARELVQCVEEERHGNFEDQNDQGRTEGGAGSG